METIVDEKFKKNIKSIFIKDMKKYDIQEYKIIQKNGNFEIYAKKNGSLNKPQHIYSFVTYKIKNKNNKKRIKENEIDDEVLQEKFKKVKLE